MNDKILSQIHHHRGRCVNAIIERLGGRPALTDQRAGMISLAATRAHIKWSVITHAARMALSPERKRQ